MKSEVITRISASVKIDVNRFLAKLKNGQMLLYIRFRILQENHSEFLEIVHRLERNIMKVESVIDSELSQCEDEVENFIHVITLQKPVDDNENITKVLADQLGHFYEDIIEMRYYNPISPKGSN